MRTNLGDALGDAVGRMMKCVEGGFCGEFTTVPGAFLIKLAMGCRTGTRMAEAGAMLVDGCPGAGEIATLVTAGVGFVIIEGGVGFVIFAGGVDFVIGVEGAAGCVCLATKAGEFKFCTALIVVPLRIIVTVFAGVGGGGGVPGAPVSNDLPHGLAFNV